MRKAVSKSDVVFGRAMVVEDGGRGVQNSANVIIGVRTSGKRSVCQMLNCLGIGFWSNSKSLN